MSVTITLAAERHIVAPRDLVWRVFSSVTAWSQWNPAVQRAPGRLAPGSSFAYGLRPLGLPLTVQARLERVEPGRLLAWQGSLLGIKGRCAFSFSDLAGGCRARAVETLEGWALLPLRPLFSPRRLAEGWARWLAALARRAEALQAAADLDHPERPPAKPHGSGPTKNPYQES